MARLTWQEVSAPDFGSSIQGLKNAFDSADRGFQRAGETIEGWDKDQTAANSNRIMAEMLKFQTPEAAQAALASGALTQGVDPRYINAAAFKSLEGRPGELLRLASDKVKLQSDGLELRDDEIDLSQKEVQNKDFQEFNSEPVRAVINARARALADGNQQEVDRLESENRPMFDRLNQVMLNASTSSAQGLRQTNQGMRATDTNYENAEEQKLVEDTISSEYDASVIGGQGESGLNQGREAFIERLTPVLGSRRLAERAFSGVIGKFRGTGTPGDEFSALAGQILGEGAYSGGGNGGNGAGGKNVHDVVLGDGQGQGGGNKYGITPPKPLTQMSLGEIYDFQRNVMIPKTRAAGVGKINGKVVGSSALGAFQIVSDTLAGNGGNRPGAAQAVFGDGWKSVVYTPENQAKLAEYIFKTTPDGKDLHKVWEGLPPGKFIKRPGMTFASIRDTITKAESGGTVGGDGAAGRNRPGTPNPGPGTVPDQDKVRQARIVTDTANQFKISGSEATRVAQDFGKHWNSSLDINEVAQQMTAKQFAGENMADVRETITNYMRKYKVNNPALMGALLSRATGPRKNWLGKIDRVIGTAGDSLLSINFDEKKLDQYVRLTQDEVAMPNILKAVSNIDRSLQGNAAAEGLVAQLRGAYAKKKATMIGQGINTDELDAQFNRALQAASGAQRGANSRAATTGYNYAANR